MVDRHGAKRAEELEREISEDQELYTEPQDRRLRLLNRTRVITDEFLANEVRPIGIRFIAFFGLTGHL